MRYTASVLAVLVMLLGVGGATALVTAGPLVQSPGSEEARAVPATGVLPAAQEMGDSPDEDGYTGEPAMAAGIEAALSGSEPTIADAVVLPAAPPAESAPQPDEDGFAGPVPVAAANRE